MKIAIANCFLPSERPSGVPFQVHQLANALAGNGHDVTVFSFSALPADANYRLSRFPRPPVSPRFYPFAFAYWLARTDFSSFDVVNVHGDNYLMRTSTPVVRTFHGSAIDEFKNTRTTRGKIFFLITVPLEWLGAKCADYVVGVSETTRARIPQVRAIIPCGVNLEAFAAGEKTEHPTILFVGTEEGRKRGAWLAELFKHAVLPAIPSAELRMVTEHEAIEPNIRRYGRVSNERLADLYRSAWAFCLPSTYEGFGVPYIEAMASRTAVVATSPNPGAREVLCDGTYGAFVQDAGLADALRRILIDRDLRTEMESRGATYSRNFGWSSIAGRYEETFGTAIREKSKP